MDKKYELQYILDTDKMVSFQFSPDIDFEKYNRTILSMYGNHIKRRVVVDLSTGNLMSLRQLRSVLDTEKTS